MGDCISLVFACMLIFGYLLVAAFEMVTEIPGLANKMQRDVDAIMNGDVPTRDWHGAWSEGLAFSILLSSL